MKTTIRIKGLLIIGIILFIQSEASAQKMQKLNGFNQIELFGKIEVRLELADTDSILIQSDTYDVEKVNFSVKDSILSVKLTDEFPSGIKVGATVFFKKLNSIQAGGGIKLYNKGALNQSLHSIIAKSGSEFDLLVASDSVFVKVNKGAFVRLSGAARVINLSASTGGDFRATELENDITYAKMSGGTAEVAPKQLLDGNISYGASLQYKGSPVTIKRSERLGGKISQLEDF